MLSYAGVTVTVPVRWSTATVGFTDPSVTDPVLADHWWLSLTPARPKATPSKNC